MGRKHTIWHRDRHMGVLDYAKQAKGDELIKLVKQARHIVHHPAATEAEKAKARKVLRRIDRHTGDRIAKVMREGAGLTVGLDVGEDACTMQALGGQTVAVVPHG